MVGNLVTSNTSGYLEDLFVGLLAHLIFLLTIEEVFGMRAILLLLFS